MKLAAQKLVSPLLLQESQAALLKFQQEVSAQQLLAALPSPSGNDSTPGWLFSALRLTGTDLRGQRGLGQEGPASIEVSLPPANSPAQVLSNNMTFQNRVDETKNVFTDPNSSGCPIPGPAQH